MTIDMIELHYIIWVGGLDNVVWCIVYGKERERIRPYLSKLNN